jgi:glycerol-3-phosphate dehydrogenase
MPELKQDGLRGAGLYHDAVMDDSKMCLEVIYDALFEKKCEALNYHELISINNLNGFSVLTIRNNITNEISEVEAINVIYAVGPFTDELLKKFPIYKWENVLLPSKGSHIWINRKSLPIEKPMVITTGDNRVIFVVPQQEKILVGTTEIPLTEPLDNMHISKDETQYILDALNLYFPESHLTENCILSTFAGVRPLVRAGNTTNRSTTSREHKVYKPLQNTYVIAGGKYTTFRVMGQEITKDICLKHNIKFNHNLTLSPLRRKSMVLPFSWKLPNENELLEILKNEMPKSFNDLVKRRFSVASRSIWSLKTDQDFDQYFLSHKDVLNQYFEFTESDLSNFI